MATIGKVIEILSERRFEWRIEDFSALSAEEDKRYESPLFNLVNTSWYLRIYPNGLKEKSIGCIDVYLVRKSSGPPISLEYSLSLKKMDEKTEENISVVFEKPDVGYGRPKLIKRSEYLKRRSELGMPDVVTVICTMKYLESTNDVIGNTSEKATCSHCKTAILYASTIQLHEKKCMHKPTRCLGCSTDFKLKDWLEHECHMERAEASEKLSQDLQAIVLSGDHSDIIIKVKEEGFQLHRSILAARNSYFNSMFKNDMKEKNTGTVTIEDCEPDIFRIFVHFLYTGKVENLSLENVCELYEVTDKYQEGQLKNECLHFMMKLMSEDTFCDFIVLALKYDEKVLLEKAVETFLCKPNAIVRSVNWQNFAREYPTQANELFVKIVDRYVK